MTGQVFLTACLPETHEEEERRGGEMELDDSVDP